MALIAFGLNHTTASLALRERVAIVPEHLALLLSACLNELQLREAVVLSTCNRTEFYGLADDPEHTSRLLHQWLQTQQGAPPDELEAACYCHQNGAALQHMMRVSCGLDSMVIGEPQILGQMKTAYAQAQENSSVGRELARVFEQVFAVAKQVRTQTAIGANPVSVASAAVRLAQHIFSDLEQTQALLIGAGDTIALTARHLSSQNNARIVVANRTLDRAALLADELGAKAVVLADIPSQLVHADIVISSTASPLPILGKGMVEQALRARKRRPIFMVDLAVPRDIEVQVGELDNVYLYSIDDLRDIIDDNVKSRTAEAEKADAIIAQAVEEFGRQQRSLGAVGSVKAFRKKAELLRDAELGKAQLALQKGQPVNEVIKGLAHALTNKLIHTPSVQMKKASERGETEKLAWSQELFDLSAEDMEPKERE
ncbi:MAG: glutamyl-tRNA reductase [Pseudomonadales bacterium]